MGRELARQLVAEGCNVAMCDVSAAAMAQTKQLRAGLAAGHQDHHPHRRRLHRRADEPFPRRGGAGHGYRPIHLLFNNAGIGGGGSIIKSSRAEWEKTFNVCWYGVYFGVRAFLPMMLNTSEGHIVNTSSVNGSGRRSAPTCRTPPTAPPSSP